LVDHLSAGGLSPSAILSNYAISSAESPEPIDALHIGQQAL
jgi:hypothetical protein